jgi:hypothetical protein
MGREIKFRAWDKVHSRFMYLTMHPTSIGWSSPEWMAQAPLMNGDSIEGFGFAIEGWQQFTGLLDKNGREIYEGDILKVTYDIDGKDNFIKVYWSQSAGALIVNDDFGEGDMLPIGWALDYWNNSGDDVEVIGNIHSNPKLLEVGNGK